MKITGIQNGMVMQRDSQHLCDIYFTADEKITSVSVSDKFSAPKVEQVADRYHLTGIRAGGPYTLTLNDTVFTDIYVGDVWLLTGQSNMQGVGRLVNTVRNNNDKVRAYYMDNHWDMANHPMHRMGESPYEIHKKLGAVPSNFNIKGVGPGLSFAQKMFDLTGVPQGVIACAHGGTNLFDQWNPKRFELGTDDSLYAATYQRFVDNGANCRGIFWYQGCSDTYEERVPVYEQNMIDLVAAFRRDFKADLPFIQVQISRTSWSSPAEMDGHQRWTAIREIQRNLNDKIDNFDTVSTISYRLADCIHLCSDAQEVLGKDAAEAMYCLIWGKLYGCVPGIKLRSMEVLPDEYDENMSYVILEYDNVHGTLCDHSRAMGFDRAWNPDVPEFQAISDVYCDANRVTIRFDYKMDALIGQYLWYGFGKNPSCNITDSHGRSLPAFGPIKIDNQKF